MPKLYIYYIYIEKFEANISREFRLVEDSFRIAEVSMVEIGSSYRMQIVAAFAALKVKGMKN